MEFKSKIRKVKAENSALNGGKNKATYKRIPTSNDNQILIFEREKMAKK